MQHAVHAHVTCCIHAHVTCCVVYVPDRPGNGGLIGGAGILCRLRGGLGS